MNRRRVRSPADFAAWAEERAPGLAFAGPDPHYGIGLESLVAGYRIASIDAPSAVDILRARGVDVFALDATPDAMASLGADGDRSTQFLLDQPQTVAFLKRAATTPLLVFKTSHAIETICRQHGWSLLGAPARLSRRWENKVLFREIAERLSLRQPPGSVVALATATYADLARSLGPRIVMQAAHGFSGARTYDVTDAASFDKAREALRSRHARATAFVPGTPLTQNACVTARGVACSAPFLQVTGEPGLTRHPLGSCGNDWAAMALLGLDPAPFAAMAGTVGQALAREGYRGIFGLDFVLGDDGEVYLIEVNPRLVASIALHTQLELAAGLLPLLARHVLSFLDPDADDAPLDAHLAPLEGAQVILHNLAPGPRRVEGSLVTGVYRWLALTEELALMRPAVRVDAVQVPGEMLVLAPARGRLVGGGQAWGRIQTRQRIVDAAGRLVPEIARAVDVLREAARLAEGDPPAARGTARRA